MFQNVVLEKDGEEQLGRPCDKWRGKDERNIPHAIKKEG